MVQLSFWEVKIVRYSLAAGLFLTVWFFLNILFAFYHQIKNRYFWISSLLGAAGFEAMYYFSKDLSGGLIVFLIKALPFYCLWFLLWRYLYKKKNLSLLFIFFISGCFGFIYESLILKQLPIFSFGSLIFYPYLTALYGLLTISPLTLLLENSPNPFKVLRKMLKLSAHGPLA